MKIQAIYSAHSIDEALQLKTKYPDARLLCGGTDIVPAIRDGSMADKSFIELSQVKDPTDYIKCESGMLRIGGMTPLVTIVNSELVRQHFPAFSDACRSIGSAQIRARASLAGNIVNASPAADSVPPLLAAEATIKYRTAETATEMPLSDFLLGPRKTALPRDAMVEEIFVPLPEEGWAGKYYKVGGRAALTIAIASVAVLYAKETGFRVAFGSVGPTVLRGFHTEKALNDKNSDRKALAAAIKKDIKPIDDVRASARYRLEVCCNLVWLATNEEAV